MFELASIDLTRTDTPAASARGTAPWWNVRRTLVTAIAAFLILSIWYAKTKKPWLDEGLNASAAYSLVAHGQFAIPQLEESGMTITARIPEIQHYCYIYGPDYMFAAAAWMKVFGYGLMQIRMFSIMWALLAMAAWFRIIERLTRDRVAAALGVVLLAVNYQFIVEAANGRFDMMCASLGSLALAAYLSFREQNLKKALFLGALAAAAAFFTHPMGLLYGAALLWIVIYLDLRRLRPAHAIWFAAPWALFITGVLAWMSPHREIANAQFSAATHARWSALANPVVSLLTDATQRYLFFFWPTAAGGAARLKVLILVLHVFLIGIALLSREVRNSVAFRALGTCLLIVYCGVALLDSMKWPYYMVHTFLFASAIVAITAARLRTTPLMPLVGAAVAGLLLIQIGGMAAKIHEDSYGRQFAPTIAYIRAHTSPSDYVEGELALNFGLGYRDSGFHMDNRMGYYTGVKPSLIVTGEFADLEYFRDHEPQVYAFIRHRLDDEYRLAAQFGDYRIYSPR